MAARHLQRSAGCRWPSSHLSEQIPLPSLFWLDPSVAPRLSCRISRARQPALALHSPTPRRSLAKRPAPFADTALVLAHCRPGKGCWLKSTSLVSGTRRTTGLLSSCSCVWCQCGCISAIFGHLVFIQQAVQGHRLFPGLHLGGQGRRSMLGHARGRLHGSCCSPKVASACSLQRSFGPSVLGSGVLVCSSSSASSLLNVYTQHLDFRQGIR
jgi:hypothetical protein